MNARRRAFTLVELLVVITIIGILLSFILKAYLGSVAVAEKTATISLIAKLESALIDRIDALSSQRAEPTWCHYWLSGIWTSSTTRIDSNQRAQVIAQFDYLRAELPDVFVVDMSDGNYPINFGAQAFSPSGGSLTGTPADFNLPLGGGFGEPGNLTNVPPVTGIKGASFAARAAINKQLGYLAPGLDGADNDKDGLIDERDEMTLGLTPSDAAEINAQIDLRLANHTHKTARAEILYAILVEGTGPLGSVFSRDDFNNHEVRDTDGDGLLEFVDAYGEPLQFFRWPIMHHSETQKGFPDFAKITQDLANSAPIGPYTSVFESREQDPLDPNQTLQGPGWFATSSATGIANSSYPWGSPRATFGAMFHTLFDPQAATAGTTGVSSSNTTINTYWDRSADVTKGYYSRRAYYSRFLVLSGGPDKRPGVAMCGVNYAALDERSSFPVPGSVDATTRDATGNAVAATLANVIQIENQGGMIDPNRNANGAPVLTGGRNDTNTLLEEFAQDDISNHNLHSAGGPLPAPSS